MIDRKYADMIVDGINRSVFCPFDKKGGAGWYETSTSMGFECPVSGGNLHLVWIPGAAQDERKDNTCYVYSSEFMIDVFDWISGASIDEDWLNIDYLYVDPDDYGNHVSGSVRLKIN